MQESKEEWTKNITSNLYLQNIKFEGDFVIELNLFKELSLPILNLFIAKSITHSVPVITIQNGLYTIINTLRLDKSINKIEYIDTAVYCLKLLEYFNLFTISESNNGFFQLKCNLVIPNYLKEQAVINNMILPPMQFKQVENTLLHKPVDSIYSNSPNNNINFLECLGKVGFKLDNILIKECSKTLDFVKDISNYVNYRRFNKFIKEIGDNSFYPEWAYDDRGRSYCRAYEVNPQGCSVSKALLDFSKTEVLNLEDKESLIYELGTCMKITGNYEDRQLPVLLLIADLFDNLLKIQNKDKFKELIKLVQNEKCIKDKYKAIKVLNCIYTLEHTGQCETGMTMELDSSGSGIQIMSILSMDMDGLKYSNLLGTDEPYKIYVILLEKMNEKLDKDNQVTDKLFNSTDIVKLTKLQIIKAAGMTHFYNSKKQPKKVFNTIQLEKFYETLEEILPNCSKIMQDINAVFNSNKLYHKWTLPDKHEALVYNKELSTIENISLNDNRFLNTFNFSYKTIKPTENYRALVANIIHSIDGWIVREVIKDLKTIGITCAHLHDCFIFSPKYHKTVIRVYHKVLSNAAKIELLEGILFELNPNFKPTFNKFKQSLSHEDINIVCDSIENSTLGIN